MTDGKALATTQVNPFQETDTRSETEADTFFGNSTASSRKPNETTRVSVQNTGSSTSTNPFRRHQATTSQDGHNIASSSSTKGGSNTHVRNISRTSNNGSPASSPRREAFPIVDSPRRSVDSSRSSPPRAMASAVNSTTRPRRSSSLRDKYPDDPTLYPLNTLTQAEKAARRSSHLRKKHHHGSDSIDKLDDAALFGGYHHGGPYDAASLARNNSYAGAPVAALAESNREALKATPRESIRDSIDRHRPLDNVAVMPPGERDELGRVYNYKQGSKEDLMRDPNAEGGAYKRYVGVVYHPDDLKGKGEPSYSIEKQLKEHKRGTSGGDGNSVELQDRSVPRTREHGTVEEHDELSPRDVEGAETSAIEGHDHRRKGSGSGLEGLKKRIGALRHKDHAH